MSQRTPLYDLVAEAGGIFADEDGWEVPAHFGDSEGEYHTAREGAILFDRSSQGKVELSGPDTRSFLQNLSTNDVASLSAGAGCEAFLANAKAKAIAHLFIWHGSLHDRDACWLDMVPGLTEKVIKHLDYYLISEQVEVADRTRSFAQLHLAGPRATPLLEQILGGLPELKPLHQVERTFGGGSVLVRRHAPLGLPGYDLVCAAEQVAALWQSLLAAGARPAGQLTYEILRIEAGTPRYGMDIDENNLVMEVDRTPQAICYTKGCFLGQEPIVRARDIGHVNWALRGLKMSGDSPLSRGVKLFREGKEAGHITSSVVSPQFGIIALGYVRRGSHEPGTMLEIEDGPAHRSAEVATLPFQEGVAKTR